MERGEGGEVGVGAAAPPLAPCDQPARRGLTGGNQDDDHTDHDAPD